MEFLDPKTQKKHHQYLLLGYVMTTIGVILATVILLSLAYGFTFNKSGEVVQRGLIFVSSTPTGATISVDNKVEKNKTNSRLLLEAGRYTLQVQKTGYESWQRSIVVNGGVVERFDYPFLVPKDIQTSTVKTFNESVALATQSRDRRWLIVQRVSSSNEFTLYDLNEPANPAVVFDAPNDILSEGATTSWSTVEWSTDNRRVLMQRTFTPLGGTESTLEYISIDRQTPGESVNVSNTLNSGSSELKLIDGKYDRFYIFDSVNKTLRSATLKDPTDGVSLSNVLAYESYSDNKLLYVTTDGADANSATIKLQDGSTTFSLTNVPSDDTYFLDMASHDNAWYVVAGARSQSRVSVYKNPIDSLKQLPDQPLVPVQVLKVDSPSHISFSNNTRFIMATNGQEFYTYDTEIDKGYQYTAKEPLDAPQTAAQWINGHQLAYVSLGKVIMFDYDYTNVRTLQNADARFVPFFDRDYRYVYSIRSSTNDGITGSELTQTALRIDADL